MNVLVYDGPGVSQTSLSHVLTTLRTLLVPNYTLQTISPQSLASDPWTDNCALLVLPGGRDLPYLSSLSASNDLIRAYVRDGGAFLGICAGAYYASKRVEWEVGTSQEVSGDRPLRFFPNASRGCVYPGFQYESESGARAVSLLVSSSESGKEDQFDGLYYNGGGEFVDVHDASDVRIIAKYTGGSGGGRVAAVSCLVGNGVAVLWSIHPEYPLTLEPARSAIIHSRPDLIDRVHQLEERRWTLMRETLTNLRLQLPVPHTMRTVQPLPQFLVFRTSYAPAIAKMIEAMSGEGQGADPIVLKDNADVFHIYRSSTAPMQTCDQIAAGEGDLPKRLIIVFERGVVPSRESTPSFDIAQYFAYLSEAREEATRTSSARDCNLGEVLLYSEAVTSTQSLLDQNPRLMSHLPSPLLSLAAHQLSGRGRGSNSWLSPPGCLQFSLFIRIALSEFQASRLVFIQYLFGLAVTEACRSPRILGKLGEKVRLKWPNDIYALSDDSAGLKKIGGILVNTSFTGSTVDIVIGCGLNVRTPSPLTSLQQIVPTGLQNRELSMELTAATIIATFDRLWSEFLSARGSFDNFMDLYLQRWLHSDQPVKLTTVEPPVMVRIVGITPNHGLLRTLPERMTHWSDSREQFIDLQPDGNSFDLMAGLIKVKT